MTRAQEWKLRVELFECVLEKDGDYITDWLPGNFARVGLTVLGEEFDGVRTPGWTIVEVLPKRPSSRRH